MIGRAALLKPICRSFQIVHPELTGHCIDLSSEIILRPDPATYDQDFELSRGDAPSWDSPDILTHEIPAFQPLSAVEARARNNSPDVTAFGTAISFAWSAFGIGLPRTSMGAVTVNLSRAGTPGDSAWVEFATPAVAIQDRRFALFVDVLHPHDSNGSNNSGAQALDLRHVSISGRQPVFDVPLRNSTGIDLR